MNFALDIYLLSEEMGLGSTGKILIILKSYN